MGYFLGIDVGPASTLAALARAGSDDVETVDLGDGEGPGVASVLHLGTDGALAVGAEAERWALDEPDGVVRGFPGRIGEDEPILLGGEPWAAEELTAWLVRWVVDRVAEREGEPAAAIALTRPTSWDAARTQLLADAVAEQDLDVTVVSPLSDENTADGGPDTSDGERAARAAARAARTAGPTRPLDGGGSGRHLAVGAAGPGLSVDGTGGRSAAEGGGSGRHLAVGGALAALAGALTADSDRPEAAADDPTDGTPSGPEGEPGPDGPADRSEEPDAAAGAGSDDSAPDDAAPDAADDLPSSDPPGGDDGWSVPVPRTARDPKPTEPTTAHLVADLVGFTGGMGATNTAGLLSGYTPAAGTPTSWSTGHGAPVGTAAPSATDAPAAVALPAQRAGSGRWAAVPEAGDPEADQDDAPGAPLRARENPTVLVGVGGLAAAAVVVATLFLWPAPRTTNSASSRPLPVAPAATAPADPTASVPLTPTPTAEPTHRPRPPAPRPRRPVVPPVTETTPPPTETTAPATDSTETTEATTEPPTSSATAAPTTEAGHD